MRFRERIKNFWDEHKKGIIIGSIVIGSTLILGTASVVMKKTHVDPNERLRCLTDDVLNTEREKARLAWLDSSRNRDYANVTKYEQLMAWYDKELQRRSEIKYANCTGSLPRREHGWYLPNDD